MLLTANIRKMLVSGEPWGEWDGYQLPVSDRYLCIWTPLGTKRHWKPHHWKPEFFLSDWYSLSYLWPGAWYTIHISYHKDGSFANGYCDIILPTPDYTSKSREIVYTDLYIDVVIREDRSVFTKDQEVYDRAARRYPIVEESRQQAFYWLDWLEQHAKDWTGPFTIIPQQLPRTDFESLSDEELRAAIRLFP